MRGRGRSLLLSWTWYECFWASLRTDNLGDTLIIAKSSHSTWMGTHVRLDSFMRHASLVMVWLCRETHGPCIDALLVHARHNLSAQPPSISLSREDISTRITVWSRDNTLIASKVATVLVPRVLNDLNHDYFFYRHLLTHPDSFVCRTRNRS